jgi:ferritin-like metal-binding protein YciE
MAASVTPGVISNLPTSSPENRLFSTYFSAAHPASDAVLKKDSKKGETMGWFTSTELDSLDALFLDQLLDLYDAEQRLVQALPKMAGAAHQPGLKEAFQNHLRETQTHLQRLEHVFQALEQSVRAKTCEAMKGLVAEGQEAIDAKGNPDVKDAALIAAAQRVEHYEIAAYGTARTFARRLGKQSAVALLGETLAEEKAADQKLTQLAEAGINQKAATA